MFNVSRVKQFSFLEFINLQSCGVSPCISDTDTPQSPREPWLVGFHESQAFFFVMG
jgi:hypothetical protein